MGEEGCGKRIASVVGPALSLIAAALPIENSR